MSGAAAIAIDKSGETATEQRPFSRAGGMCPCATQISDLDEPSVGPLLASLRHTVDSFVEIGLGYLSLERPSGTLSGGEASAPR